MKKTVALIILVFVMSVTVFASFEKVNVYNGNFTDVPENAWFAKDVRTAYENHKSSIAQAKLAQDICDLTRQTRDLVQNEYNAGTALVTRLNEAERDLVQAQNNLATALVNIANTKAQLDAAIYSFTPVDENK